MSRVLVSAVIVAFTLPLAAQEAVSPLVEAAKRANRLGKIPARVITNDDVATSTGRISVAAPAADASRTANAGANAPANAPVAVSSPVPQSDYAALEAAAAGRRAEQAKAAIPPPPPQIEGSSRASYSARDSSVTNAAVTSSVSNTMLPSSARTVDRDSRATSSNYDQTASNSTRDAAAPTRRD